MILRNSPAEPITTIKSKYIIFCFALFFAHKSLAQTCTQESNKVLLQGLVDYLGKPSAAGAKAVATGICKAFSADTSPKTSVGSPDNSLASCNLSFTDDMISKFETAAQTIPEVISIIKCAAPAADISSAQDLNELQARLLDKYKDSFFKRWDLVKGSRVQKPEDFVTFTPEFSGALKKRSRAYEARLATLEKAPASLKAEFKKATALLKEEISLAKKESSKNDDSEITFKTSQFREQLSKKLKGSFELANATARANEILLEEGLNFRARLKTENRNWKVCSASTSPAQEGSCHVMSVSFDKETDSCGAHALLGLLFQSGDTWVVMSGSSGYRITIDELLAPDAVNLTREKNIYHGWNLPDGFSPEFVTGDLHSIYAKTSVYDDDGKKLGNLHLVLRDNGRFQFVEIPKDQTGLFRVTGKENQQVKSLDGSSVELHLPRTSCAN